MGRIKVLSELVANKIAAGEVVERPASIVKELVENALDAGARTISVSIGYGGKSSIKVKDDGCGMDKEDARACLLRHATSKISEAEDIERICSLGFRGEALPSIASVSRLTLTTRQEQDQTAALIKSAGGVVESTGECVAEPGTTIEVSDLFFNTPARKKFLKSDAAEYNAIADVFDTLALSRSDVGFSLIRNTVPAATYPACAEALDRITQVYGSEFTEKMYAVTIGKPDFKLTGHIGTPDNTRVNRTGQKFFINKRPVQSIGLSTALNRAYDEFMERGRFPVAVLFLEIEASHVDVNVHPAKREVRLRNERYFQDTLVQAVKKELHQKGFFLADKVQTAPSLFPRQSSYYSPEPRKQVSFTTLKEAARTWEANPRPARFTGNSMPPASQYENTLPVTDEIDRQKHDENPFRNLRISGQVLGTYIIAEQAGGIVVFDQHAAHERILYEELLDAMDRQAPASQKVIFPVTLHLTLQEAPLMEEHMESFQKLGFSINPLGGGTFSVDAIPACMTDTDTAGILKDTLHELMEGSTIRTFENQREGLAAILACKTYTVKAGQRLSDAEMSHLIELLGTAKNPHICPHGRPTFFLITRDELEKRFKRT